MWRRRRTLGDFDAEIEAHLALEIERLVGDGLSREQARAAAHRRFGNVTAAQERFYESRRLMWLDHLRQDVRYALRGFGRHPGFTAVTIATLALGIGANTAIFSVVNTLLLRPLPYRNADRLVRVVENVAAARRPDAPPPAPLEVITASEFRALRSGARALEAIGVYGGGPLTMTLTGRGDPIRLAGDRVSPSIFPLLGAQPLLGRGLAAAEEAPDAEPVVVLSFAAWQRHFGGAPGILGGSLVLDGKGYSVVGIMEPGFEFPNPQTEFWLPISLPADGPGSRSRFAHIARLQEGWTVEGAAAEIGALLQGMRGDAAPGVRESGLPRFRIVFVQDQLVAPVKPALLVLTAAVGLVLLIACTNVTNLLLARAAARTREMGIRVALGAGRGRLLRQLLTESLMLAVGGGAAGVALAAGGLRLLRILGASLPRRDLYLGTGVSIPRLQEVGLDTTVLAFAAAVSILTALAFGLAPAIHQTRTPWDHGASRRRIRNGLIVAEIAMAMIVLAGGGLLVRSFVKLSRVDPGYDAANLSWFQVFPPRDRSSGRPLVAFAEDLASRLRTVPGVRSVGYALQLPTGNLLRETALRSTPDLAGPPPVPPTDARIVSTDFMRTMGIPVIAGRGFDADDAAGSARVMLINRRLAQTSGLGAAAIGRRMYALGSEPWEIVGIAGDVRQFGLDCEPSPQVFVDFRQLPGLSANGLYFTVRTDGQPGAPIGDVRGIVRQLDPAATVDGVATMEQLVSNSMSRPRLYAVLLGIFAAVAVTLAAVGLYALLAYTVVQRGHEIGVRMALGASGLQIMRLLLGQGLRLTAIGIVLGVLGAAAVTRYLETMLFGLTPLDPLTFFAVAGLFAAIAALAAVLPARRAANVDPVIALRCE